jgi:hypothetical protein
VAGTSLDRAPSHDSDSMIGFLLNNGKSNETEIGQSN